MGHERGFGHLATDLNSDFGFLSPLSLKAFLITLCLSAFLSYICIKIHLLTSPKKFKRNEYQQLLVTIILLSPTVATIILVVGRNLAHAFALMGMLSLIRFRNPSKGPGDLIFLLLAIAIGMSCGAQYFSIAASFTALISLLILGTNLFYRWRNKKEGIFFDTQPPAPPQ